MKKILLLLALLSAFSFAKDKNNALGLWLQGGNPGETWGADYKHLGTNIATDIYFRIKASNDNLALGLYYGHYFVYNVIKADASMGRFPLYWGPVGGVGYWSNGDGVGSVSGLAIRLGVTGGISWVFPTALPMDISLELNPLAEMKHTSWETDTGSDDSNTTWEIPDLFFRIMFHIYLF